MDVFFLFAPGAGAPSSHAWMQHWAELLREIAPVELFDYDYMREGRRRPDPLLKLIAAHRAALAQARRRYAAKPVLIGKSMGGRVGCHVSLEEDVAALICLGYPLCGGGDPDRLRDEVLRQISTPILFVQGARDPLCPLPLLEAVRPQMQARNELYVLDGGDHSLLVSKKELRMHNRTQKMLDRGMLEAMRSFVASVAGIEMTGAGD